MAATMIAEATHHAGISKCQFGKFKLMAQRIGYDEHQARMSMELIVSYADRVIEHDKGPVSHYS